MLHLYATAQRKFVSRLVSVEVHSAIVRLERETYLSPADAQQARLSLAQEASNLEIIELTPVIASLAQSLLERHRLRSLDAIQLAACTDLINVDEGGVVALLTRDARQREVAMRMKFTVL